MKYASGDVADVYHIRWLSGICIEVLSQNHHKCCAKRERINDVCVFYALMTIWFNYVIVVLSSNLFSVVTHHKHIDTGHLCEYSNNCKTQFIVLPAEF